MTEQLPVGIFLGMPIYGYSIVICISILASLALTVVCQKARSMPSDMALRYGLWAIPLGVAGARLFYCLVRWDYVMYERGWTFIFTPWIGGFALYGALLGCLAAAMIFSRIARVKAGIVLDVLAPGAALMIAGARFAEALTTQGVGRLMEAESLQCFPFAVLNTYGEWVMPVFFYEGITAAAIGVVAYTHLVRGKSNRPGDTASVFLLLFGASQVLLESLRQDDYLRWGFVKVSQLMSMGLLMTVSVLFFLRVLAAGKHRSLAVMGLLLQAAGVGCSIVIEFALDKSSIPNEYLYVAMAATLAAMVCIAFAFKKASNPLKKVKITGLEPNSQP